MSSERTPGVPALDALRDALDHAIAEAYAAWCAADRAHQRLLAVPRPRRHDVVYAQVYADAEDTAEEYGRVYADAEAAALEYVAALDQGGTEYVDPPEEPADPDAAARVALRCATVRMAEAHSVLKRIASETPVALDDSEGYLAARARHLNAGAAYTAACGALTAAYRAVLDQGAIDTTGEAHR